MKRVCILTERLDASKAPIDGLRLEAHDKTIQALLATQLVTQAICFSPIHHGADQHAVFAFKTAHIGVIAFATQFLLQLFGTGLARKAGKLHRPGNRQTIRVQSGSRRLGGSIGGRFRLCRRDRCSGLRCRVWKRSRFIRQRFRLGNNNRFLNNRNHCRRLGYGWCIHYHLALVIRPGKQHRQENHGERYQHQSANYALLKVLIQCCHFHFPFAPAMQAPQPHNRKTQIPVSHRPLPQARIAPPAPGQWNDTGSPLHPN